MRVDWLALSVLSAAAACAQVAGPQAPSRLRVEYTPEPLVDAAQPRLSWALNHTERAQAQTAFQVVAASDAGFTAVVWDSGKTASSQSTQVVWAGKPLESAKTYYWKVRYWDRQDRPSAYSEAARFHTGLLARAEWSGKYITGANQLRKEFTLKQRPRRAWVFVTGLGYYELRLNGKKVGDHALDPGWTTYEKRVLYAGYDVTRRLHEGANAVAVTLGSGWYAGEKTPPTALVEIRIELEDGAVVRVASDETWKTAPGPILSESVYHGERYDARRETPGWDRPGFDAAAWKPATVNAAPPKGELSAQTMPPIRVVDGIVPLRMSSPKSGVYVYDMGQNFSGWVELRVKGPRGTEVRLRHAETLYPNGNLNVENLRRAKATDVYVLRGGDAEEVYQPRFTYHGFRYVELSGFPGTPKLDSVHAKVVHTDVAPTGGFSSSNDLLNRLHHNILWGITSNLHSVPTDCNQRDERMGWLADAHLYAEPALLNFDAAAFYTNFLRNIRDAQDDAGAIPDTVPHRYGGRPADPAWGAAYPLITWFLYEYNGDRRILEEHYEGVKKWTELLRSQSRDGVLPPSRYGDWVPVQKTPTDLVATFFYYYSAHLTSRMAMVLGKAEDGAAYARLAGEIKDAFNRKYWDAGTMSYGNGTQTAQILPLYLDLAPNDWRGPARNRLTDDIVYANNTHLTTGIIGAKYVMELLTRTGRADLAYEIVTQKTYPSWGYMIERGATTLWELWQEKTGPSMNSHNHPMFGSVDAWFYNALAGVNLDPERPGYERIRIEPQTVRDLEWVSGSIETLRGPVISSWRRTPDELHLETTIPTGSVAEVHLRKNNLDPAVVTESGRVVWKDNAFQSGAEGVRSARQTRDEIVFEIGSGGYIFELRAQ